jgi:hypothetical protein
MLMDVSEIVFVSEISFGGGIVALWIPETRTFAP